MLDIYIINYLNTSQIYTLVSNFILLKIKFWQNSKGSHSTKGDGTTPLMRQYNDIKSKYPDALLLFRVGDFYETFGEDAVKVASILGIVLTSRNNGGNDVELAGFLTIAWTFICLDW